MTPSVPEAIGRYQILHSIGQGGMGSIYLARDPKIGNRQVVIKVLREGFDNPEMRERFAREANAAGGLRHVNIVTIFDVGDFEGQPFIAMEYIKGTTLTDLIDRRAELPLARKLQLMEELCAGLNYAHKAGVVHRDVKPANIMIDEEGLLKIVDFGIARLRSAGTGVTRTGTVMGTLNYMAPEQMAGQTVDARADIFSFGAVFYEVLSYRKAFPGDFPSIIQKILTAQRDPLDTVVSGLDPALLAIVDRCLAKDPGDRRADLNEVRLELAAIRQRIAIDDHLREERQLKAWLEEARGEIERGALTSASLLVERALSLNSSSIEALAMRKAIDDVRRRLVEGQEKTVVLEGALQRARRQLDMGAPDAALQAVNEALQIDATHSDTLLLKHRVDSALVLKQRAEQEAREQAEREDRARTAISDARRQFAAGERDAALKALESFRPQYPIVTNALTELQVEAREIERRRADAERQKLEADVERLKREAEAERRKLDAEAERRKLDAEVERHRLEVEAERQRLEAEVERLKREGQEARRKIEVQSARPKLEVARSAAPSAPRADGARARSSRGLLVGGIVAAAAALVLAGWMLRPSNNATDPLDQQAAAPVAERPAAVPTPAPADVPQQAQGPAPVESTPPPAAESRSPNIVQQAPRGRGRADQNANVARPAITSPIVPARPAPLPPAAATTSADALAARNRDLADRYARGRSALDAGGFANALSILEGINRDEPNFRDVAALIARGREGLSAAARQALDNGTRLETAGDLPAAVQQFERGRQIDPSVAAAANQSINRLRARMKTEGTEAFARGRANDALDRIDQAIAAYDLAFRYLPDDDPNRQVAKARLDALRARQ